MSDAYARQTTDAKQGGEGTKPVTPAWNPGPMTTSLGQPPANTTTGTPPIETGTK